MSIDPYVPSVDRTRPTTEQARNRARIHVDLHQKIEDSLDDHEAALVKLTQQVKAALGVTILNPVTNQVERVPLYIGPTNPKTWTPPAPENHIWIDTSGVGEGTSGASSVYGFDPEANTLVAGPLFVGPANLDPEVLGLAEPGEPYTWLSYDAQPTD